MLSKHSFTISCVTRFIVALSLLTPTLTHASTVTQPYINYRAYPGGEIYVDYNPQGTECRDSIKGTVKIGETAVSAVNIKKWNVCRGFINLTVPDGVPYGRITLNLTNGQTYTVGELLTLAEPVISSVQRQVLTADNGTVSRFTVTGSNFGGLFYDKSLFIGRQEVITAGWSNAKIWFELTGSFPNTDLVTLRAADSRAGISRFVMEPNGPASLPPTITAQSDSSIASGSELVIYGYGFKGGSATGESQYTLRVTVAGTVIPADSITTWTDIKIALLTPATLNTTGTVKVELVSKNGAGTLSAEGPPVSVLNSYANDPSSGDQDYLHQIRANEAWKYTHGSSDVIVAVIDSGVDTNQVDLSDNIWTNKDELPGNGIDDDNNGYVDDTHGYDFVSGSSEMTPYAEHGTAVAGIIGAIGNNNLGIAGINWSVQIMPVTAIGSNGGTVENVGKAIRYAADNGAQVINLSLGGLGWTTDYDASLTSAMTYAFDKGAVIVSAAGNGDQVDGTGRDLGVNPNSPVCNDGDRNMVIGVASVDEKGVKSAFSDYGPCIDLVAPGENILTFGALGSGEDSLGYGSGTSFAAPMVSGAAALLKAANPKLTNVEIRDALMSSAQPILLLNNVYGPKLGSGLLNVEAALAKVATVSSVPAATASVSTAAVVTTAASTAATSTKTTAKTDTQTFADRVSGRILLQVQQHGEAWYVRPETGERHYMKDGDVAYQMMRNFGLGITDTDLGSIPSVASTDEMKAAASVCSTSATANRLKGRILLQVQQHGEAWYIDPDKCRRIYMKDGAAAYAIMRFLGLGITDADLDKVTVGE